MDYKLTCILAESKLLNISAQVHSSINLSSVALQNDDMSVSDLITDASISSEALIRESNS